MALSDTVRKLNDMQQLLEQLSTEVIMQPIRPVLYQIENSDIDDDFVKNAQHQYNKTRKNVQSTINLLENAIDWYHNQIDLYEPEMFQSSYSLFDREMINDSDEVILGRQLNFDTDTLNYIDSRIKKYSAWKHSGAIVAPRDTAYVENLVSLDPLYVLDERESLLDNTRSKFNELYQSRLRYGVFNDRTPDDIITMLPDNQLGYILIYNFFHYRPIEIIGRYISELYQKVKPGGTVAFTINDCDWYGGVALAERSYCCYTPGSIVIEMAEEAGFNLTHEHRLNQAVTWLEIQKPGELTSIKGGQSLIQVRTK